MEIISDFFIYPFLWKALIACIFLSLMAGILSPIIVAKKMAIIGEGIGHSTFFTSVLTLWIFQGKNLSDQQFFWIVLIFTWILSLLLALFTYSKHKSHQSIDSFIAGYLSLTLSLGIILHSQIQTSNLAMSIEDLLFGNILFITNRDIALLILMSIIVGLFMYRYFWSIISYTYDETTAFLQNVPNKKIHFILFFILATFIVSAVKLVGPILVTTLLVIPGVYAQKKIEGTSRLPFAYSIAHCLFSTIIGLFISNYFNVSTAAIITVAHFILFFPIIIKKYKKN